MTDREWTVDELIAELKSIPPKALVRIEDADTGWTIPKFSVQYDGARNELWIRPCEYKDMTS